MSAGLIALSGCGLKGDLYIPEPDEQTKDEPEAAIDDTGDETADSAE